MPENQSHVVRITRPVTIPDRKRLSRYQQVPDLGPRILFFSGGNALRETCRQLIRYTFNTIHLVTPFDSGGSSAKLREAFAMLSVGDLRNRLMALADPGVLGNQDIYHLFAHRFPDDESPVDLLLELERMIAGEHRLVAVVADPMRKVIRNHLRFFREAMPETFDLRGASIGNLILTGGYLNNDRSVETVSFMFSRLVEVRGLVRPTINADAHLAVTLADGSEIVGQHLITGKNGIGQITKPIRSVRLVSDLDEPQVTTLTASPSIREQIDDAEMIVYPIGSFYSSLISNLLIGGIGQSVAGNPAPKLFIPNTGVDPEMLGLSVAEAVEQLLVFLQRDQSTVIPNDRLLNYVLVDSRNGSYPTGLDLDAIAQMNVEVVDTSLVSSESAPRLDPALLAQALVSLA